MRLFEYTPLMGREKKIVPSGLHMNTLIYQGACSTSQQLFV
jgi:hypothetical protein